MRSVDTETGVIKPVTDVQVITANQKHEKIVENSSLPAPASVPTPVLRPLDQHNPEFWAELERLSKAEFVPDCEKRSKASSDQSKHSNNPNDPEFWAALDRLSKAEFIPDCEKKIKSKDTHSSASGALGIKWVDRVTAGQAAAASAAVARYQ